MPADGREMERPSPLPTRKSFKDEEGLTPHEQSAPRKRLRLPNSCSACRKRKCGCDKARPACGTCVKRGVASSCQYEDPTLFSLNTENNGFFALPAHQAASKSNPKSNSSASYSTASSTPGYTVTSNTSSQTDPINPIHQATPSTSLIPPKNSLYNANEIVTVYDKLPFIIPVILPKSRLEYQGAFSPLYRIKNDTHLKIIWLHMWKTMEVSMSPCAERPLEHIQPASVSLETQSILLQFLELKRQRDIFKAELRLLKDTEKDLITICLRNLPPRRTIHALCTRFTDVFYPFVPAIDVNKNMNDDFPKILGDWSSPNQQITELKMEGKLPFAYLASLFLMMGIASIAVDDDEYDTNPRLVPLKEFSPMLFASIGEMCIDSYNFLRKSYSKCLIQAMLLLHFYNAHCPENDTEADYSHGRIMTGTIYSMARGVGLQVEPLRMAQTIGLLGNQVEYHCNSWTKVWYTLLEMDAREAMASGNPMHCSDESVYDSELPRPLNNASPVEVFVCEEFKYNERKIELVRTISDICLQRRATPTVGQMLECVELVQEFTDTEMGSLVSVLHKYPNPNYERCKKLMDLFEMWNFEFSLRNMLLTHFKKERNIVMINRCSRTQLPLAMKIIRSVLNVGYNMERYLDKKYEVLLRSAVVKALPTCTMFLGSLLAEVLQAKQQTPADQVTQSNLLKTLYDALLMNIDISRQYLIKVNNGFYNGQTMNVALSFFAQMIRDPEFTFESAVKEVTSRVMTETGLKPNELYGVRAEDVPKTTFLMELLDTEVEHLLSMTSVHPSQFLQPLYGPRVVIYSVENLFSVTTVKYKNRVSAHAYKAQQSRSVVSDVQKKLTSRAPNSMTLNSILGQGPSDAFGEQVWPESGRRCAFGADKAQVPSGVMGLTDDQFSGLFGLFEDFTSLLNSEDPLEGTQFAGMY